MTFDEIMAYMAGLEAEYERRKSAQMGFWHIANEENQAGFAQVRDEARRMQSLYISDADKKILLFAKAAAGLSNSVNRSSRLRRWLVRRALRNDTPFWRWVKSWALTPSQQIWQETKTVLHAQIAWPAGSKQDAITGATAKMNEAKADRKRQLMRNLLEQGDLHLRQFVSAVEEDAYLFSEGAVTHQELQGLIQTHQLRYDPISFHLFTQVEIDALRQDENPYTRIVGFRARAVELTTHDINLAELNRVLSEKRAQNQVEPEEERDALDALDFVLDEKVENQAIDFFALSENDLLLLKRKSMMPGSEGFIAYQALLMQLRQAHNMPHFSLFAINLRIALSRAESKVSRYSASLFGMRRSERERRLAFYEARRDELQEVIRASVLPSK